MSSVDKLELSKLKRAANIIRALNHELRMQLLEFISKKEPIRVKSIYHTLGLEQAVASMHLGILRDAGAVKTKRDGRQILYSVDYERLDEIKKFVDSLIEE